ncbi:heterokaryon incompatibility protein-domain-containing protein [Ganoderma leucocontextum]|nr:heterokaryon incompatibility protein-domain-containing protein [Ganoderma leucocontextum]
MRLLDTHTGHFVEFYDISNIRYAILSHTWDPRGEQTYQDVREIQECHPIQAHGTSMELERSPLLPDPPDHVNVEQQLSYTPGFWDDRRLSDKIRQSCEIARFHGYRYLWIDSCCIDKTSSSELSEAINSMYTWYGRAAICYAFLADVPHGDIPDSYESAFRKSRWFRRGWTLQELIAPSRLVFLSSDWQALGSKSSMAGLVEQITRIDRKVLTNQLSLDKMSVARRMSWAAERETTRVEDRAYSLLGIFDLNMPTLYGEGERAFRRLQEEILRRIPDQTLFALNEYPAWPGLPIHWGDAGPGYHVLKRGMDPDRYTVETSHTQSLFGSSPSSFIYAGSVDTMPEHVYLDLLGLSEIPYPDYSSSPYGIRSSFPIIPLRQCFVPETLSASSGGDISEWYLVVLGCYSSSEFQGLGPHLLARVCRVAPSPSSKVELMTVGALRIYRADTASSTEFTVFTVTADQLKCLCRLVQIRSVYLPHPDRASPTPSPSVNPLAPDRVFRLALSSYTSSVLRADGYGVEFHEPLRTNERPWTYSLVLRRHDRLLQLNIDEVPGRSDGQFLSAAAWSFTAADAEHHRFPLSTCRDPDARPHDAVVYRFGSGGGGFPTITLPEEAKRFEGVVIRLELEEASAPDSSVSHYLHVDVEELDWYVTEQCRGASVVQQIVELCSQAK